MDHDSLEDYLKLAEQIEKESKVKNLLTTAQKRKECERKALGVVQLLLERSVSPELFLKSITYLNPSYYEDIAEERALLLFCGYPLCRKRISKPKTRYRISNKSKKVYDLTEYGNFCSVFCFNASNHIKQQILDSPLWLRDLEETPTFNLLVKKDKGSSATGINIQLKKLTKNEEFTTITSFAKLSLDDVGDIDFSVSALNDLQKEALVKKDTKPKLSTVMEKIDEETENLNDKLEERELCDNNSKSKSAVNVDILNTFENDKIENGSTYKGLLDAKIEKLKNTQKKTEKVFQGSTDIHCIKKQSPANKKVPNINDLTSITNKIKNKMNKSTITMIDPLPLQIKTTEVLKVNEKILEHRSEIMNNKSLIELKFSTRDSSVVENTIRNVINNWITLETLIYIHGENKLKETLDENKLSEHFENLKISQLEIDQQKKYVSICRRLCEQEIFEEKVETLLIKNNLRPLPDYQYLKRESKEFDIKVRTFLSGGVHEADDKNFGPEKVENTDQSLAFLPLDDNNSRHALRQKILSDTLNKSISFLLEYIKYDTTYVLTELNKLIKTFKLDAENIVLKPVIRNYIAFICLKILSLKDFTLCEQFKKTEVVELENSIFEQLPGKKEILDNTIRFIVDVDKFLETYVMSTAS